MASSIASDAPWHPRECPASPFGQGRHQLHHEAFELDFGLKVTLNSVDADKLRSLDVRTIEEVTVHTRRQVSRSSSLDAFNVDIQRDLLGSVTGEPSDTSLAKRLTGQVQHRGLTPAQWEVLLRASQQGEGRGRTQGLDPLARGDAEDALAGWLDERGVENAWDVAPTLLDAGLGEDTLRPLVAQLPGESLAEALAWLESSVRTRTLLAEVCQSTKRMSELARAVKSYARTEEHPQADVDVHEGLENTLLMLTYKLKHGVEVTRHYERSLPHLTANASELIQVWTNLVDNAIDAMKGQGHLEVRTARDGDGLLVEIIDDGPGILPDVLPQIFEPFFTTKPAGQGTGLGLDISHRIVVDNHHGTLRVESRPGRTAFQVRLPLGPPAPR